jgi:hypothetical protein
LHILFGTCLVLMGFLLSIFFDNSKTVAQFGSIFTILLYIPSYLKPNDDLLMLLSFPIAYRNGFTALIDSRFGIPFQITISFLLLDAFILFVLVWYFSNTIPSENGNSFPWLFFLDKDLLKRSLDIRENVHFHFGSQFMEAESVELYSIEENPLHENPITLRNISKAFSKHRFSVFRQKALLYALNDLSLDIHHVCILFVLCFNHAVFRVK